MPWVKGQSGNPGGRVKGLRVIMRKRFGEGEALIASLHQIAKDEKHPKRFDALKLLAAYQFGQPIQPHDVGGELTHRVKVVVHECVT